MTQEKPSLYRTYLIRCWQEGETSPGQNPHWRFWVEEIARERQKKGFSSLEALFAFFKAELADDKRESP